jgi:hypothetical protein
MQARIQLVTIIGAALLLLTVLELVRRRRLTERYALLWLLSACVLLALSLWSGALSRISHAIGVIYPPNALFFIAIGCILLLLLHFSAVVSRLSDQTETLAQRQALLDERLRRQEQHAGELTDVEAVDVEAVDVEAVDVEAIPSLATTGPPAAPAQRAQAAAASPTTSGR